LRRKKELDLFEDLKRVFQRERATLIKLNSQEPIITDQLNAIQKLLQRYLEDPILFDPRSFKIALEMIDLAGSFHWRRGG